MCSNVSSRYLKQPILAADDMKLFFPTQRTEVQHWFTKPSRL